MMVALCDRCKSAGESTGGVILHILSSKREVLEVLSPLDMVAIEATAKGVVFHMKDGREVFEYFVLKDLLVKFPGMFIQVERGWLISFEQIKSVTYTRPGHRLTMRDSGITVPVSRRAWPALAERLGMKVPHGRFAGDTDAARAHMDMVRAHTTRSKEASNANR